MLTFLRNAFLNSNRYREDSESIIISCFFNPQNSPYRLKAFNHFYDSIKHMNHLIIECVIGETSPQLPENKNIQRVYTENLLWHKEALLNLAVSKLPKNIKYVFWVDADVIFTNKDWLTDSVKELKSGANILQPFEYCVHLDKDELQPSFDLNNYREFNTSTRNPKLWRSFCSNYVDSIELANSRDYNIHGHVGFAWGAKREILDKVPLYDKALIGGADHIIAHAAAGQVPHPCINKSFTDDLDSVYDWSQKFSNIIKGKVAYTYGDLYHIWHGDIEKRQYLKRIQEFTPTTKKIVEKDKNGLYVTKSGDDKYIKKYFAHREVSSTPNKPTHTTTCNHDDGFMNSMAIAYMTDSELMGMAVGGNPMGAILGGAMKHSHHDNYNNSNSFNQPNNSVNEVHHNNHQRVDNNASENFS